MTYWMRTPRLQYAISDWTELVDDSHYVKSRQEWKYISSEMEDAVQRAIAAGAQPPLEFIGAGMTGIVLCEQRSGGRAFKVARKRSALFLEDEAEWLAMANRIPGVREHVARFYGYDAENFVVIRECARLKRTDWWKRSPKLTDIHKRIGRLMEPYGWSAPEFKEDSYVSTARGPILVDASMPHRLGRNMVKFVLDVLAGRRYQANRLERLQDLAYYVRREATEKAIPKEIANQVIWRIAEKEPSATKWVIV